MSDGTAPAPPTTDAPADNFCTRCGACCTGFRVDFDHSELRSQGGCVPDDRAVELVAGLYRMRGTDQARPRCSALAGEVGQRVSCTIHAERPSPCRVFGPRAPVGIGDEACTQARARHGLAALPGERGQQPSETPR
jgi:Fe-S-cluster containining protein